MPSYTTTALISLLKQRINVPTAQGLYSNSDFLSALTLEMQGRVVDFYLSHREDFFLKFVDQALVTGTLSYALPVRAIGQKLNNVLYYDSMPADNVPSQYPMQIVSPGEANDYGYYFQDEKVHVSKAHSTGFMRFYYYRRPATLVELTEVGTITIINRTTGEITISTIPTDFTVAKKYDFVGATVGFYPYADDLTPTNIVSNVMTFAVASIPAGLAVGDYICEQYEAPVPQIPIDAIDFLIAAGGVRLLQRTNYQSAYQLAITELASIEKGLATKVSQRVDRNSRKFSNRPFSTHQWAYRRF